MAISNKRRVAVASAMLRADDYWTDTFAELGLNDLNYSDLFFQMWLHAGEPLTKTSLYDFMPGISRRTAVKYVQDLIDRELLIEKYAVEDRRVKYISLSAEVNRRLEMYLDFAYEQLRKI
ncbi:MAG: hypothetical protein QM709_15870 [Spongiibacteraceae bacterium]